MRGGESSSESTLAGQAFGRGGGGAGMPGSWTVQDNTFRNGNIGDASLLPALARGLGLSRDRYGNYRDSNGRYLGRLSDNNVVTNADGSYSIHTNSGRMLGPIGHDGIATFGADTTFRR